MGSFHIISRFIRHVNAWKRKKKTPSIHWHGLPWCFCFDWSRLRGIHFYFTWYGCSDLILKHARFHRKLMDYALLRLQMKNCKYDVVFWLAGWQISCCRRIEHRVTAWLEKKEGKETTKLISSVQHGWCNAYFWQMHLNIRCRPSNE